jgi:hypothetical protein
MIVQLRIPIIIKLWEGDEKGTTFEFSTIQNFSLRAEFWIVESQITGGDERVSRFDYLVEIIYDL